MKYFQPTNRQQKHCTLLLVVMASFCWRCTGVNAQNTKPVFTYTVSMSSAATHYYHVALNSNGWNKDTIEFKMPQWMPGYYQIMYYGKAVENFSATDKNGKKLQVNQLNEYTWQVIAKKNQAVHLNYDVKTDKQFVANSYIDTAHAYMIPCGLFMYVKDYLNTPVSIKINLPQQWTAIATGLQAVTGAANEFTAPDFDILYDSPLLAGNLEELSLFMVNEIPHRFIGYKMAEFDRVKFMANLKKVVEAAVAVIGDIPYQQYTFIGIGPGRGGIEHLNNTTVSFDGKGLDTENGMNRIMNFLAHEYFHHYNVKRIRPFELGPFDYDKGSRTNLLWVSEGLSVYYEYLIVKRAGLSNEQMLLKNFENNINTIENNTGRHYQSLTQASYDTWGDGPFGKQGEAAGKSISYYDKGPIVGMLLDFSIRNATKNKKSLDDVMRLLYHHYYKQLQRGFTDAEFQQACEQIAGTSLTGVFEYVYTTKEIDYTTILAYAGLKMETVADVVTGKKVISIKQMDSLQPEQLAILQSWLGK